MREVTWRESIFVVVHEISCCISVLWVNFKSTTQVRLPLCLWLAYALGLTYNLRLCNIWWHRECFPYSLSSLSSHHTRADVSITVLTFMWRHWGFVQAQVADQRAKNKGGFQFRPSFYAEKSPHMLLPGTHFVSLWKGSPCLQQYGYLLASLRHFYLLFKEIFLQSLIRMYLKWKYSPVSLIQCGLLIWWYYSKFYLKYSLYIIVYEYI